MELTSKILWAPLVLALLGACTTTLETGMNTVESTPPLPAEAVADDPLFAKPYIDIDEWRDTPVRHRYIHGGFEDTQTRFSYYFPPEQQYQGRFIQYITPVPVSENLAPNMPAGEYSKIGFSIDSGAYFIETNGGGEVDYTTPGGTRMDPTITAYRANAAAAQYSRAVAQAIYGNGQRPFGYCYGGSGGGFRTIGSMENTDGVWDGSVPFVIGSSMAIPNMFTVRMHAMRILKDQFPQIVDAVEPGGSGDAYASLTPAQADALREVTRMGFPTPAWFGHATMGVHGFAALYQGVRAADPEYFTDFWTEPGYLGHDQRASFDGYRLQFQSTVAEPLTEAEAARLGIHTGAFDDRDRGGVDSAFREAGRDESDKIVGYRLTSSPPEVDFLGGDLRVNSGAAEGRELALARIAGDVVVLGIADAGTAELVQAGDAVTVDNSNFLAAQTYHRHQVPGPDFPVWDQFRDQKGEPIYPQRPMLLGPLFVQATSGSTMTGEFDEKMIVVASLWDREAMPWQADWYRQRVASHLGGNADQQFRLYYTDHALHGDEPHLEDPSRVVPYQGMLQQALRDLAAWVEQGIEPPASTGYRIDDGQVIVPDDAAERKGLQPVVTLAVNGAERIDVTAGTTVEFSGAVSVPPGTGAVVSAEWDFDGTGEFPVKSDLPVGQTGVTVTAQHRFDEAGTWFVALRGASQRAGDTDTPYGVIRNLARVRVVVSAVQ
jgi:hypothetical protein